MRDEIWETGEGRQEMGDRRGETGDGRQEMCRDINVFFFIEPHFI